MNLRYLAIFQIVCEEMNMTKAGQKLNMSQPSISQVIKDTESHYGVKMFDRVSKKLYLTEAGETLLNYTKKIMFLHDEMELAMESLVTKSKIRIGATDLVGTQFLSSWSRQFYQHLNIKNEKMSEESFSKIELLIQTASTQEIINNILSGKTDIGFCEGNIDHKDLNILPLFMDECVLIASNNHPLASFKNINIEDIDLTSMILSHEASESSQKFKENMKTYGLDYKVVGEFSNCVAILNAVENQLGIGLVSKYTDFSQHDVRVIEISNFNIQEQINMVYHKKKSDNKSIKTFVEFMNQLNMK